MRVARDGAAWGAFAATSCKRERHMGTLIMASALLVTVCTLLHYEALRLLSQLMPRLRMPARARLIVAVMGAFASHSAQIALYGVAYWLLVHVFAIGEMGPAPGPAIGDALYFSAETYTSLGFGDLVPHGHLRHLTGVETLNGLLLIGWTASFLYVAMERFWGDDGAPAPPGRNRP